MTSDEKQIRDLVATWHRATKAGDLDTVLSLMTDDVVFLTPGRPPMTKADFAAASQSQAAGPRPEFDSALEIQELQVAGDWAFMQSHISLTVTPPGGDPIQRAGHTLTVFRKFGGKWLLARDANLLTVVSDA